MKKVKLLAISALAGLLLTACAGEQQSEIPEVTDTIVESSENSMEEGTANDTTEQTESQAVSETETTAENATEVNDEKGTFPDGSSPEYSGVRVRLTVDGQEVVIAMYENTAADAFLERLPMENLNFSDLSGIEKPVERPEEAFSLGDETPGYDPVTGEMVIYRPWGNFTIFYGDFRYSEELVPLGKVESGLDILAGQTQDFTGTMELIEE